jgi:predicted ester cyclase
MDAREIGTRYFRALGERDVQAATATLAPNCRAEIPGSVLKNRDAIHDWMTGFFDAFPDVEHECGEITVAGDTVSAELRVHGNHTRPLLTPHGAIPATNRPMEIRAMNHLGVGGGAITKLKISFDAMDMMRQLGIGE